MKFSNEIIIKDIQTDLYGSDYVSLRWDVLPINPSGVYLFNVYRSAVNEIADAEMVCHLIASSVYNDTSLSRRNRTYDLWYWVSVNKQGTSGEDVYGPKHLETRATPKAMKIRKDEELLLRKFIKNDCYFLIKRRFGERCACVNNGIAFSECGICYGVGFIGGYYSPLKAYIGINTSSSYHDDALKITEKFEGTQGWTTYGPTLTGGDMVFVPRRDVLYLIKDVNKTILDGVVLRQIFSMTEVPAGHIAYSLINDL